MADIPKPWRTPLLRDAEAGVRADAGQHSNRTYYKLTLARPPIRPLCLLVLQLTKMYTDLTHESERERWKYDMNNPHRLYCTLWHDVRAPARAIPHACASVMLALHNKKVHKRKLKIGTSRGKLVFGSAYPFISVTSVALIEYADDILCCDDQWCRCSRKHIVSSDCTNAHVRHD